MEKPKAAGTLSKRQFYFATAVMTPIFTAIMLFLGRFVSLKLDLHTKDFTIKLFWLLAVNWVVSCVAAACVFKMLGMSRSGDSVETWDRIPAKPDGFVADDEVVEHKESGPACATTFVFMFVFGLLSLLGVVYSHLVGAHPMQLIFWCVGAIVFGGHASQTFVAWDGCYVRADRRGVFGYPARYALRRKLLPWSEIATCDIVTRHDLFGRPYLVVPVFKNESGTKLMTFSLWGVPMECQLRLVKYIKARLVKARVEFAEV